LWLVLNSVMRVFDGWCIGGYWVTKFNFEECSSGSRCYLELHRVHCVGTLLNTFYFDIWYLV
jgi:hypothetical protein